MMFSFGWWLVAPHWKDLIMKSRYLPCPSLAITSLHWEGLQIAAQQSWAPGNGSVVVVTPPIPPGSGPTLSERDRRLAARHEERRFGFRLRRWRDGWCCPSSCDLSLRNSISVCGLRSLPGNVMCTQHIDVTARRGCGRKYWATCAEAKLA